MDSKDVIGLIAAIVPGVLVAWIAARYAAKSQTKTTQATVEGQIKVSKEEAEANAYQKAADLYERTIKRLEGELSAALEDIDQAKAHITELETRLGEATSDKAAVAAELAAVRQELNEAYLLVSSLRNELGIATSLLQRHYPDDHDDLPEDLPDVD